MKKLTVFLFFLYLFTSPVLAGENGQRVVVIKKITQYQISQKKDVEAGIKANQIFYDETALIEMEVADTILVDNNLTDQQAIKAYFHPDEEIKVDLGTEKSTKHYGTMLLFQHKQSVRKTESYVYDSKTKQAKYLGVDTKTTKKDRFDGLLLACISILAAAVLIMVIFSWNTNSSFETTQALGGLTIILILIGIVALIIILAKQGLIFIIALAGAIVVLLLNKSVHFLRAIYLTKRALNRRRQ